MIDKSLILIPIFTGRNVFSYGRNEGNGEGGITGTARPEVLDKLLASTERVVQEIDSVCLVSFSHLKSY